jgi:1-acyl-sn-glycerol-3-phosphate acyltransferase
MPRDGFAAHPVEPTRPSDGYEGRPEGTAAQRVLSWLGTAIFLPVFGVTLVVFDVAQRVARLFGQRPQEYVAGALQRTLVHAFRLCDTRLLVERAPGFERHGSYLVVSNHQSMFDIAIIGSLLFWNFPKYVSKRELGRWIPSVSYNLRRGGHALIDRSDGAAAVAAIRELGGRVERGGVSAVIFPEGTRARGGALGDFRRGGAMALLEAAPDVPVVPLTIDRSWRLLAHNMLPVPWGVRVRVHVGEPILRRPDEDRAALIERVRDEIAAVLRRWRAAEAEPAPSRDALPR